MYEELIKSLREDHGKQYFARDREAADAIEELQSTIKRLKAQTDLAIVEEKGRTLLKIIPKWIPVTERLPEYMENVLVTDGIDVGIGWYDIYKRRDTGIIDKYWCTPNCDVDSDNVKYWAEMPSPPEREGE